MIKMNCTSNENIYRIDGLFPKVNSLEYLPTEVLLTIFAEVRLIDLFHLTHVSSRLAEVAEDAAKEYFANNIYYHVYEEHKQKVHEDVLSHFGSHITKIQLRNLQELDTDHWLIKLMNEHLPNLTHCQFDDCTFNSLFNTLSQQLNLSELKITGYKENSIPDNDQLPDFRHLTSFTLNVTNFRLLDCERIILNNPQLKYLELKAVSYIPLILNIYALVSKHLNHIKVLNIFSWTTLVELIPISAAMENLEEFSAIVDNNSVDALRHISSKCKNIEKLEIQSYEIDFSIDLFEAIRTFTSITTLILSLREYIESLVVATKDLPNLNELMIAFQCSAPPSNEYILHLLRECESIEVIEIFICEPNVSLNDIDINADFHEEFLDIVRNRPKDVKIRIRGRGDNMKTTITKSEIVCRNQLIHWIGWYSEQKQSDLNLLDLNKLQVSMDFKPKHQPLEMIVDKLDINSLYALYQTSLECRHLVENFMEKHFKQKEKLLITKENETNLDAIRILGHYVTNLKVIITNDDYPWTFWTVINQNCSIGVKRLKVCEYKNELSVDEAIINRQFYFPNIEHFEYSSKRLLINFDILRLFFHRKLKTLKFETDIYLINNIPHHIEFNELKKIEFHRPNESINDFLNSLNRSIEREISFEEDW